MGVTGVMIVFRVHSGTSDTFSYFTPILAWGKTCVPGVFLLPCCVVILHVIFSSAISEGCVRVSLSFELVSYV